MLENRCLRLKRCSGSELPARWLIHDPHERCRLGLVRLQHPGKWWHWLAAPVIEVLETDDEALVFTLDRYWNLLPTWIIRDADQRLVGQLRGASAWDAAGQLLGQWRQMNGRRCFSGRGQELAELQVVDPATVTLTFLGEENPFTRMILLAEVARR